MDGAKEIFAWIIEYYEGILIALATILSGLEAISRLIPTKKPYTFLERCGYYLRKLMDALKIPNMKREDGKLIAGQHEKKS